MARMLMATFYMKIKFSTSLGISFLRSDQCMAMRCHMLSARQAMSLQPRDRVHERNN
ncbi:hypothetical protein J1N35_022055 [Gossypium stocksii]|uniref:Uncharacterized protein n=1 Tax=Gossypium stocksii TaxID=47602 RepID=A0A9D3VHX2_9ROSI|nr:hypothetical protein J1N35_022055 [Gossypium stocksii]